MVSVRRGGSCGAFIMEKIKPGKYVLRFPNEAFTPLRRDCWWSWYGEHADKVRLLTAPVGAWPAELSVGVLDKLRLANAQKQLDEAARAAGYVRANKLSQDRDEYQGFEVMQPVELWDFRGDCAFAAWPWDGISDLEVAAHGRTVETYDEIDAAADAVDAVVERAKDIPEDIGRVANEVASASPWWLRVGASAAAIAAIGYGLRSIPRGKR